MDWQRQRHADPRRSREGIPPRGENYVWRHARASRGSPSPRTPHRTEPSAASALPRRSGPSSGTWIGSRCASARSAREEARAGALLVGSTTVTGQTLTENVGVDECIAKAMASSGYADKGAVRCGRAEARASGGHRRGRVHARRRLHGVGRRRLKGRVTVGRQAGELPPDPHEVDRPSRAGHGDRLPPSNRRGRGQAYRSRRSRSRTRAPRASDSGPTVACTVMVVGSIVSEAAAQGAAPIRCRHVRRRSSRRPTCAALRRDGYLATVQYEPPLEVLTRRTEGTHTPRYAWGCDVAEVEVDLDTLETRVIDFWAAQDMGGDIHPVTVRGPGRGGHAPGHGLHAHESIVWKDGKIMNGSG